MKDLAPPGTTPDDLCADAQERSPQAQRASRRRQKREARIVPCEPICVECGKLAEHVKGDRVYPHRRDLWVKNFYLCECGAYVGCHPFTRIALGRPAGPLTRAARNRAHNAFDLLWRRKMRVEQCPQEVARNAAYDWLAGLLGYPRGECHIGWMTAPEANAVVRACDPYIHRRSPEAARAGTRVAFSAEGESSRETIKPSLSLEQRPGRQWRPKQRP